MLWAQRAPRAAPCCAGRPQHAMATTTLDPVNPPDYGVWPTARRLLRLWREQRRLVLLGLACAFAYAGVSLTIPLLVARAIDRSIVHHRQPLWPLLVAI